MQEDSELGYLLSPSVNYSHDIPKGWRYVSLNEVQGLYDPSELIKIFLEEYSQLSKSFIDDIQISNPCIFTGLRNFMFIGYIVKIQLQQIVPFRSDDTFFPEFFSLFEGKKDYITMVCNDNCGVLEWLLLEDFVGHAPEDYTELKVTEWPKEVWLPDTTI